MVLSQIIEFHLLPTGKDGDQEVTKPHLLSSGDPDSEISGEFSADDSFLTCGVPDSGYQSSGQGGARGEAFIQAPLIDFWELSDNSRA
tara:strand:+ start:79 stop:342 length:264 start_codon:yes stop_codon:yes gene_type:complete